MDDFPSPTSWITPIWHPDYGDAAAEIELLRDFALALLAAAPDAGVALEVLEPGYMLVSVKFPNGVVGEVHVVDGVGERSPVRRLAVFMSDDEDYADTPGAAARIVLNYR